MLKHILTKTAVSHRQARHGGAGRRPQLSLRERVAHRSGVESVGSHALVRRLVERFRPSQWPRAWSLTRSDRKLPGSILTPSAFCGVTGLRPTYGLVCRQARWLSPGHSTRSDPCAVRRKIAAWCCKRSQARTTTIPHRRDKSFYYTPQFARDFKEIRVGFAPVDFNRRSDPAARPDFAKALETVRSLGVQITKPRCPNFLRRDDRTIISAEGLAVFEPLIKSGQVDELADQHQIAGFKAGFKFRPRNILKAMRIRASCKRLSVTALDYRRAHRSHAFRSGSENHAAARSPRE